jgi:hypothetical protein
MEINLTYLRTWFCTSALACVSTLLCSTNALSAPELEHWQQPDYIEQSFVNIALKNEYVQLTQPVHKWLVPIRVQLIYRAPQDPLYAQLINMHLQHLTMITGHDIALEDDPKKANIKVILSNQELWTTDIQQYMGKQSLTHVNNAVCMASLSLGKHDVINHAVVIIPVDQARMHRKLVSCIVEEITQVLGLPNDSDSVYPSIFNDHTPDDLLTGLDGLLLKLLYQPKLKAGMSEQQVRPIIRRIIAQWMQDGTIANANHNIHQGQLYPLMGY